MLFYSVFCGLFLGVLAPKTFRKGPFHADTTEKSEAIFADVIKNISRVNNVLQELINNYEQLQKIYKSQENFDNPESSSDAEIDRFYKVNNKKSIRNNKESRFFQNKQMERPATTPHPFKHETEMILSEIDMEKSREFKIDPSAVVNEPMDKKPIEPNTIEPQTQISSTRSIIHKTSTTTETNIALYSAESSSSVEMIEIPTKEVPTRATKLTRITRQRQHPFRTTKSTQKMSIVASTAAMTTYKQSKNIEPEIIFVDTHKKTRNRTERKKPRIMPEMALEQPPKKIKTRYSVQDMPNNAEATYEDSKQSKYLRDFKNASKPNSKRVLQFPQSTPMTESNSEEIVSIKYNKTTEEHETNIKSGDEKNGPVNLRTLLNANRTHVFIPNDKPGDNASSEMTDDDEALTKDVFKTSVLRQAYGDACLKLVVRKCYKACKNTLRASCRAMKCKSDIKSFFKTNYKTGCDKAFEDSPSLSFRRILKTEGVHADLTRAGYLSVVCQPHMETGMPVLTTKDLPPDQTTQPQNKDQELNILRDKYEKACTKISQNKCRSACNYAQNATCVKFECSKKLKKNFKRNCGNQCKLAYTSSGSKGSSSDSDSDDDSDSESDTDESDDDDDES